MRAPGDSLLSCYRACTGMCLGRRDRNGIPSKVDSIPKDTAHFIIYLRKI